MKGLLALLAKPKAGGDIASNPSPIGGGEDPNADQNFTDAAGQCLDAIKSGDVDGFAEALRSCIEMAH